MEKKQGMRGRDLTKRQSKGYIIRWARHKLAESEKKNKELRAELISFTDDVKEILESCYGIDWKEFLFQIKHERSDREIIKQFELAEKERGEKESTQDQDQDVLLWFENNISEIQRGIKQPPPEVKEILDRFYFQTALKKRGIDLDDYINFQRYGKELPRTIQEEAQDETKEEATTQNK